MEEILLMEDMSDSQRLLFQSEMNQIRKNRTTALLLTLFLGGVGAARITSTLATSVSASCICSSSGR